MTDPSPTEPAEPAAPASPVAAPRAEPAAAPRLARGAGLLAGVCCFALAGLLDGVVALLRAPTGALHPRLAPLVLLHCVAIFATPGLFLGLAQEVLLASGASVPWIAALGRWLAGGPRRWFAADPGAAHTTALALVFVSVALAPVLPASYWVIHGFHSHLLAALAVVLIVAGSLGLAAVVSLGLAGPLRFVLAHLGRLASPGFAVSVAATGLGLYVPRFVRLHWRTLRNLDGALAGVAVAALLADALVLLALSGWGLRRGRALSRRVVGGLAASALAAFLTSALTFGARQTVSGVLFTRSIATGQIARGLQLALDFDRDGYSAVFGGGDCNDRNARINPGARDVPSNGVDENCSGRDAVLDPQEGDGHMLTPLPTAAPVQAPSVVFLSVDAMRPDHMGAYGYARRTTPNIDRFAQGAARFTNAYTVSPRSLRSFGALWTGRYASQIAWGLGHHYPPLEASNETLAEQLRVAGYRTAAFSGGLYFSSTVGFYQGFEVTAEGDSFKADGAPTVERLRGWLREREAETEPFFGWMHLMEAHDPYEDRTTPVDFGHAPVDQYDEDLARADELLGPVFEDLDRIAAQRPLVVVVFGDHGEAFGEHGVFHHSFDLHDEALRVPLLVRGPGIEPGTRAPLAALFDLQPTVLNLARRPVAAAVAARSLAPVLYRTLGADTITPRGWRERLFAEVTPDGQFPFEQKSMYEPPYKLLFDMRRGTWELFDISRDPGETRNLYDLERDRGLAMRERLLTWVENAALPTNRTADVIAAARLSAPPRPMFPVRARFADVFEVLGVDVPTRTVPVGGEVQATFYYRVLSRTRTPLLMDMHFTLEDGSPPSYGYFRAPHYPLAGRYPTTDWVPAEFLRDDVRLLVEPLVQPGVYRLRFAATVEADGARLSITGAPTGAVVDGGTALDFGPITVTPAAPR